MSDGPHYEGFPKIPSAVTPGKVAIVKAKMTFNVCAHRVLVTRVDATGMLWGFYDPGDGGGPAQGAWEYDSLVEVTPTEDTKLSYAFVPPMPVEHIEIKDAIK